MDRVIDAVSACGPVRDHNEDFVVVDDDVGVYGVFDGMGYAGAGIWVEAAAMTTAILVGRGRHGPWRHDVIADAFRELHHEWRRRVRRDPRLAGTGACASVLFLGPGETEGFVAQLGDTQAIVVDDDDVDGRVLIRPHLLAWELPAEVPRDRVARGIVTRALGTLDDEPLVDIVPITIRRGAIVLVSDGVRADESDEPVGLVRLGAIVRDAGRPAEALVAAAIAGGSRDNCSAVVVRV